VATQELEFNHPEVGDQLREAAVKLNLSQTQVAKLTGLSRRHVALAFRGANISLTVLKKLAKVLKLSAVRLEGLDVKAGESATDPTMVQHAAREIAAANAQITSAIALLMQGSDAHLREASIAREVAADARKRKNSGSGAAAGTAASRRVPGGRRSP
jgi:transcriptional regulator with XRE-family HTH domain